MNTFLIIITAIGICLMAYFFSKRNRRNNNNIQAHPHAAPYPLPVAPYTNQPYYQPINTINQVTKFPVNDSTRRIQINSIIANAQLPAGTNVKIKELDAIGGGVQETYNFNPNTLVFDNIAGTATSNPYSNTYDVTFTLDNNMNNQFNYGQVQILIEYRVI